MRCDWKLNLLGIILIAMGLALVGLGYVIGWVLVLLGLIILAYCGIIKPEPEPKPEPQPKRVSWHDLARSHNLQNTRIYHQACINGVGWKRNVYGRPSPGPGDEETIYLELNQVPPYTEAQIDNAAFNFPQSEYDRNFVMLTIRDWYAGDSSTIGPGSFIERTIVVEGEAISARNQINPLDDVPRPSLPSNVYGKAIVKFLLQVQPTAVHEGNGMFLLT